MSRIFIGIGSNEGDRLEHISQAAQALDRLRETRLVQMATIRETAPVGGPPQGPFLNTVVELNSAIAPGPLLRELKTIERWQGRRPSAERWGPRPIDLDLLLYDDRVLDTPELTIPHPRLPERRFVLEPLAELAPDARHPVLRQTMAELLAHLAQPAAG